MLRAILSSFVVAFSIIGSGEGQCLGATPTQITLPLFSADAGETFSTLVYDTSEVSDEVQ